MFVKLSQFHFYLTMLKIHVRCDNKSNHFRSGHIELA